MTVPRPTSSTVSGSKRLPKPVFRAESRPLPRLASTDRESLIREKRVWRACRAPAIPSPAPPPARRADTSTPCDRQVRGSDPRRQLCRQPCQEFLQLTKLPFLEAHILPAFAGKYKIPHDAQVSVCSVETTVFLRYPFGWPGKYDPGVKEAFVGHRIPELPQLCALADNKSDLDTGKIEIERIITILNENPPYVTPITRARPPQRDPPQHSISWSKMKRNCFPVQRIIHSRSGSGFLDRTM